MKLALIAMVLIPLVVVAALGYGIYMLYIIKFRTRYAKPNEALLISGINLGDGAIQDEKGNYVKIVRGGSHRLRMQQKCEPVPLNSFQLNLAVTNIMVQGDDNVNAEATTLISIGDTDKHVLRYAEQFMGKAQGVIEGEIRDIMTPHFRSILTTLSVPQINADRNAFNEQVKTIALQDLDLLGFKISSFGLGNVVDSDEEGGYLHNAERKRKAAMKREAEIAESQADRETRIQLAEDNKSAKEVENAKAIEVAQSDKEKALQEAEIAKEKAKVQAEAEAAKELERTTQQKRIVAEQRQVAELEAEKDKQLALIKAEEEKAIALKRAEQEVEEEAKRQERLKIENDSKANIQVRKAQADSEVEVAKAKATYEADLEKAKSEAEKQRLVNVVETQKVQELGKAEAEAIRDRGNAEAEVTKAKGLAEIEIEKALAEIKLKTADIYLREKAIEQLPAMADALGKAIGAIEGVKVIQTGGNGENPTDSMTSALIANMIAPYELIKETTGVDIGELAVNKSNQPQISVTKEN